MDPLRRPAMQLGMRLVTGPVMLYMMRPLMGTIFVPIANLVTLLTVAYEV